MFSFGFSFYFYDEYVDIYKFHIFFVHFSHAFGSDETSVLTEKNLVFEMTNFWGNLSSMLVLIYHGLVSEDCLKTTFHETNKF